MRSYELRGPLRTDRLILRLMTPGDLDDVHAWMSDPAVTAYQLYDPRSRDQVAEHIAKVEHAARLAANDDFIEFAIALPATADDRERVIGCIYFVLKRVDDGMAEIGWALNAAHQGKGFAHEAASAVIDLAFVEMMLHRVTAELDPRNAASVTLCERLGMRREAHYVEDMMFKGAWADTGVYAILDREWAARA